MQTQNRKLILKKQLIKNKAIQNQHVTKTIECYFGIFLHLFNKSF
jgi:hypothetical protein